MNPELGILNLEDSPRLVARAKQEYDNAANRFRKGF
jgi:hypothetical protein